MNPKDFDVMVLYYWLLFMRAPGRETLPGEPVDLGEIGTTAEKNWIRGTPYSVADHQDEQARILQACDRDCMCGSSDVRPDEKS